MQSAPELPNLQERLEAIRGLELFDSEKVWMSLVALGEVPAWEVRIDDDFDDSKANKMNAELIAIGFETELVEPITIQLYMRPLPPTRRRYIAYSNSQADTRELAEVTRHKIDGTLELEKIHRALGRLYGFPVTATEAFLDPTGNSRLDSPTRPYPEEYITEYKKDYMRLAGFVLSREHWKEELKTPQRWAATMEKEAPELWHHYLIGYYERLNRR